MNTEHIKRKLTTILEADVVGYSAMMATDEESTLTTFNIYRDVFADQIERHDGRIFNTAGDAILAEFNSAVEAVRCAIAVQEDLATRNAELTEERRMLFRVGINVGDVMVQEGDLFGDGVNVAARLESLAPPGGICISGTAFEQVKNKISIGFEDLGAQQVKNIPDPVPVFRIVPGPVAMRAQSHVLLRRRLVIGVAAVLVLAAIIGGFSWWSSGALHKQASIERMTFALPDKPSVAVLPFENLSGNSDQDYLADGITENIITTLSQIPKLFVIAHRTTSSYKGAPYETDRIAEDLGVRYLLTGSVQTHDATMRISAQLSDALTGEQMWAEQFDRALENLFEIEDEITRKISLALQIELTEGEQLRIWREGTDSVAAWTILAKGMEQLYGSNVGRNENLRVRRAAEEALEIDPDYAFAYALIAWTHWFDAQFGWNASPADSIRQAENHARRALAVDPALPDAHALFGAIHLIRGEIGQAIKAGERAVDLNPNHAINTALLGMSLNHAGRHDEAVFRLTSAIRLSPYHANWFVVELAWAYFGAGRPQDAALEFRKYIARETHTISIAAAHTGLAIVLSEMDREDEARAEIIAAKNAYPGFSLRHMRALSTTKDEAWLEMLRTRLTPLGLPD